ncbi:hypothetical protein RCF34_01010 [Pseudomonas sp. 102515]|uniref:hypothetical protein n=1 Tax=Pseudomonas sp. 102515 TaxID=3071568 RepID=UPI00280294AD|nr:hypothetical protein [Pseudomonas sp. 102515]MDQ7911694.1 hypothetical protein [Pseudomonas sp. 102515]
MTSYSFKKRTGTDTSDPEFVLQHCGKPTRIQIQDLYRLGRRLRGVRRLSG